jgi:hypothetical protein
MDHKLSSTFTYTINDCSPDGWARVEYRHEKLGNLIKNVFIPLNHSAAEQRGAIVMQFPSTTFHARWLDLLAREAPLAPASMEGSFTHRIDRPMEDPVGLPLETHKV